MNLPSSLNVYNLPSEDIDNRYEEFVASTIIGARVFEQLEDSFKAFDFRISDELLKKIEHIQKEILYPMG